jgi:hypothetical protein
MTLPGVTRLGDPPVFVLDGFWYGIKALTEVRQHWIMVDGSSVAGVLRGGRTTDQHGVGYHLLKPRRRFQDADQVGISLILGLAHHEGGLSLPIRGGPYVAHGVGADPLLQQAVGSRWVSIVPAPAVSPCRGGRACCPTTPAGRTCGRRPVPSSG